MAQTPQKNLKSHEVKPSEISNVSVVFESQIPNSTLRRTMFAINTTTYLHRSLLLLEWRSQIEYLLHFHFLVSFGTEEECVRISLRLCLYLCMCANMSKYGFHKVTVRWCNQNCHYHFQSNFSKGSSYAAHLATEQNMGERRKERQKDKDEVLEKSVVFDTNTADFGKIPQILSGGFGWRVVL